MPHKSLLRDSLQILLHSRNLLQILIPVIIFPKLILILAKPHTLSKSIFLCLSLVSGPNPPLNCFDYELKKEKNFCCKTSETVFSYFPHTTPLLLLLLHSSFTCKVFSDQDILHDSRLLPDSRNLLQILIPISFSQCKFSCPYR